MKNAPASIDAYLDAIESPDARRWMEKVRAIVTSEVPDAQETISYGMPTFKLKKNFFWFAAFKKHCSIFGMPVAQFGDELNGYKQSKGTLQFPYNQDPPEDLVRRLVRAQLEAQGPA